MPYVINKCPELHIEVVDPPKDVDRVGRIQREAIKNNGKWKELFDEKGIFMQPVLRF